MLAYLQRGGQMVLKLLRPNKKLGWVSFVVLGVLALTAVLVTTPSAFAMWDTVADIASRFCLMIATLFLKLTIFVLTFIIQIAAYNGYLDSTAVNYGWVMVRDITNMGFVVILLLIAFGTILGLEQYEWKKMMVKFVLAAILVNFSRVICGVMIDVAQVIMVTFINGVAATAGGNLIQMFNMDQIMKLTSDSKSINPSEILMASVAGVFFAGLMLGVMCVFLIMLAARMLTLWVLIVLSPLAFVLSVIPQTQKYASEWWQNFGNNVISGPVIAFFLWLSFVTVGGGTINSEIESHSQIPKESRVSAPSEADKVNNKTTDTTGKDQGGSAAGISSAMSWDKMANFVIAIGMLLVGAKTAQQLGVTGGSMMSKATDFAKKAAMVATGVAAGKWAYDKMGGAKGIAKTVGMNVPLVGGKAWQRRGALVKDKLLQGATKWNEKVGSRLGSWAQFGSHEKIMKERKEINEMRKGQMSSAAKGFQGFQIKGAEEGTILGKRTGGIEKVRKYADELKGETGVRREATGMERSANEAESRTRTLVGDAKLQEKRAKGTIRKNTADALLQSVDAKIILDILDTDKEGLGTNLAVALAARQANEGSKQTAQAAMVEDKSNERKKSANEVKEKVEEIRGMEKAVQDLAKALEAVENFTNLNDTEGLRNLLPQGVNLKDTRGEDLTPEDTAEKLKNGDSEENKAAIKAAIVMEKAKKEKELREAKLEFGGTKVGLGGTAEDIAKQISLLEAIQKELAQKPGNVNESLFAQSDKDVVESLGYKPGQKLDAEFRSKNQSHNLEAAVSALKNLKKQQENNDEVKKKNPQAEPERVSLSAAGKKSLVDLRVNSKPVTGKINMQVLNTQNDGQKAAFKSLLSGLGLTSDKIQSGLSDKDITDFTEKINRDNTVLSSAGISSKQELHDLIKDLKGGNSDFVHKIMDLLNEK